MGMTYEWNFNLHDVGLGQNAQSPASGGGSGWINICTAGAATSPTVYTNRQGTTSLTKTNTISVTTITNGKVTFYTDTSVTSLDVSWLTSTGECGILKGVSPNTTHMLRYDSGYTGYYNLWVPFAYLASSAFTDTTLDLAADLVITDANILVKTVDASATVDVGFINSGESGDEDGLLDGMATDSTGLGVPWGVITNDTVVDYVSDATGKYGAYMATYIDGSAATSVAAQGGMTRKNYLTNGTIKSLGYTPSNSDTMEGFIVLTYHKAMG